MQVEAAGGETLVRKPEALVEQRRRERYSFQVKLENVKSAFDEEAASALELDPEMSAVERAERYLWETVPSPVQFADSEGARHQALEWDPTPVACSGFMGCLTHSMRCHWTVPVPRRPSSWLRGQRRGQLLALLC